ncbi:MAG: hypothetical protein KGL16_13065 [Acidobacteriota bacterium]|nr:hypothetical protein [Acidobacteriota bacterium]
MVATALLAQGAQASTTPTITLDQSAGTQAGRSQNLGMDLKFTNSPGDSPQLMTITLPPGLLANASINGGACLQEVDLTDANCQVGTGMVTAYPVGVIIPLTLPVTFDLVRPPAAGDLAGLAVNFQNGTQIGTTADIRVRPSGDAAGVGISITLTLPNSIAGVPIQVAEINSTFDSLRYPATCPSTPAPVAISVDTYNDATVKQVAAGLSVTGCSSLTYAPKLSVSAVRDPTDRMVQVTTAVTQAADESPSKSLTLAFPGQTLGVNLGAVKLLCVHLSSSCTPVGTVTAVSPDYPTPLTASAYLTGTALGPDLTLVFPEPFPLTLTGSVTLATKTATFTGLPDIPLTKLKLVLNGGPSAMFLTNCNPGNGSAAGSSTDQNGDKTVSATVSYSIVGCAASSPSQRGGSGRSRPGPGPSVTSAVLTTSRAGQPTLSFRVSVPRHAAKLTQLSVKLSHGISLVRHRVGGRLAVTGVTLSGARATSLSIAAGRLLIRLRRPASSFRVRLTKVLHEDDAVAAALARHRAVRLRLTLSSLNTRHQRHTVSKLIRLRRG